MAILDPSDYTVLWLAPLEIELQAARLMLDEHHGTEFPEAKNCIFHAGRMCGYNVIIAHVLDRSYGVAWAASVIGEASIFKNIQFSLLVGVAAGLPNPARKPPIDIRLGDVLVARVEGNDAAIIPYGFGKETENDGFQLMGSGHVLEKTKKVVSSIISTLKLKYGNSADFFLPHYNKIRDKDHQLSGIFMDPGQENDILYQINDDGTEHIVQRRRRPSCDRTRVWYGTLGSGDKLMKNARKRNELRDEYDLIGLEMEAAGVMNIKRPGVIRGVCDYGDRHKNDEWQPYAAAMAASYAKALLAEIPKPPDQNSQFTLYCLILPLDLESS